MTRQARYQTAIGSVSSSSNGTEILLRELLDLQREQFEATEAARARAEAAETHIFSRLAECANRLDSIAIGAANFLKVFAKRSRQSTDPVAIAARSTGAHMLDLLRDGDKAVEEYREMYQKGTKRARADAAEKANRSARAKRRREEPPAPAEPEPYTVGEPDEAEGEEEEGDDGDFEGDGDGE